MGRYDIDKLKQKLIKKVDEARFTHSIGVAYTAAALAMVHCKSEDTSEFIEKALVAGLLHDYAKCFNGEEMIEKCEKHNIAMSEIERENPFLLHGKLGAYYVREKLDIKDEDILGAITWHTTGKPDMSLLEKIIYTADYIEPGRDKAVHLTILRTLAFTDLDRCIYQISDDTLNYLSGRMRCIDDMTVSTRDYYKEIVNGQ